jgi:hypothetical protein
MIAARSHGTEILMSSSHRSLQPGLVGLALLALAGPSAWAQRAPGAPAARVDSVFVP